MADVQAAVQARLVAHAGTNALIAGRAWYGMLPQSPSLPAVVVQQISGPRNHAMSADAGKFEARTQVRSCDRTRAGAKALAEQARAALQRYRGTSAGTVVLDSFLTNEDESWDDNAKIWSVLHDFLVWVEE